ncbi:hypothetical protein GE09DRAFT_119750 [Coniochaeta sp. 2T2.1]|nr:hypothetical protein GE09DRAFT_119750 [Coniochaeta sp. 2T2.1]
MSGNKRGPSAVIQQICQATFFLLLPTSVSTQLPSLVAISCRPLDTRGRFIRTRPIHAGLTRRTCQTSTGDRHLQVPSDFFHSSLESPCLTSSLTIDTARRSPSSGNLPSLVFVRSTSDEITILDTHIPSRQSRVRLYLITYPPPSSSAEPASLSISVLDSLLSSPRVIPT